MEQRRKYISELGINDMVTFNGDVWFITRITKTQFTVQKFGSDGTGKYDFVRIMKSHGDLESTPEDFYAAVVGQSGYARVLVSTPEEFYAAIEATKAQKKAVADEKKTAWEMKKAEVKAANSNIVIIDEGLGGLKKAAMINSKGEQMMVYFSSQPEDFYTDYSKPVVTGVRIRCSTWRNDSWGGHDSWGFSSTDARGYTVEEALVELVASHYFN
jgi:hypothetical protein